MSSSFRLYQHWREKVVLDVLALALYRQTVNVPKILNQEQLLAACDHALRLAPAEYPPTLASSKELLGAPEWYSFEHEAWAIGEQVRQALVRNPKFKKDLAILKKILDVATCRNLRRGRQSFIMVLGFVAARGFANDIVEDLKDPDVNGQIIWTLLKMKAAGFATEVVPLLSDEKTWIRNLAKKYVTRYPQ